MQNLCGLIMQTSLKLFIFSLQCQKWSFLISIEWKSLFFENMRLKKEKKTTSIHTWLRNQAKSNIDPPKTRVFTCSRAGWRGVLIRRCQPNTDSDSEKQRLFPRRGGFSLTENAEYFRGD